MAKIRELLNVPIPSGYRSMEAALFVAQLDDQLRLLTEDTRGLTPAELSWQPAPGMNTIGMLLAHNALVEVWWTGFVLEGLDRDKVRFEEILGITGDDDGMPLPKGGRPPAILAGRHLAFFDDLLARARGHLKDVAAGLSDTDLTRTLQRLSLTGQTRTIELRWTLYHILEHFAGHYGQILLLKHAHQAGLHVHEDGPPKRAGAKQGAAAKRTRTKRRAGKRPAAKRPAAKRPAAKAKRPTAKPRGRAKARRASGARAKKSGPKRRR